MNASKTPTTSLKNWLAWLETEDCPCQYEWQSLGTLHRISMGHGWVRLSADPACPHHGDSQPASASTKTLSTSTEGAER